MHSISESIQQSVRDFRGDCSAWEDEVWSLLDDVDQYLAAEGRTQVDTTMAAGGTVAADVVGLKGLVEQQTEVLAALVNALTAPAAEEESASECDDLTSHEPTSEVDPFERLQQVVAAASTAS